MKKILLVAAISGMMMVSCNTASQKAEDETVDFKSKIENCNDPDSVKMYIEQAMATAQQLASEGKTDEARDYLADLQAVVAKRDSSLVGYFDQAKTAVMGLIDTDAAVDAAKDAASDAVDAAKDKADDLKDAAADKASDLKDAAAEKVEAAKEKAAEKVDAAKEKAAEKAQAAKEKAAEKAQAAKEKAAEKVSNFLNK